MSSTKSGSGEPDYAIELAGKKDLSIPYYLPDVRDRLSPQLQKFLLSYAGIASDHAPEHMQEVRDEAWSIRAYPCIGLAVFFQPPLLPMHPAYSEVVERLRSNSAATFVDVGCFLGIELRYLYNDLMGSTPEAERLHPGQLTGIDIVDFWQLGFKMFRDGPRLPIKFIRADALTMNGLASSEVHGNVDILNVAQVLHQLAWDGCVSACKALTKLLRGPGSLIIGNQVGNVKGGGFRMGKAEIFQHNPETWQVLWRTVGEETETQWDVDSELRTWEECGIDPKTTTWLGEGARMIFFTCRRKS